MLSTISLLGEISGHKDGAEGLISQLKARIAALPGTGQVRTLVLEWTDPPMSAGHWIPEPIELAGGSPVLSNPGENSRRLEWNAIAVEAPDAVIVAPCGFNLPQTHRAVAALDSIAEWRALDAYRGGRVLALDGNAYLSRPGPRLVEAAEIIARWYTGGAEYAG